MFFILGEPAYTASSWYKHILDGILAEKRSKRFNLVIVDSILETDNFRISDDDALFLVGSDQKWLECVIDASQKKFSKNIIVLGNFERRLAGRNYSLVSSDISADVCNLYTYLVSYDKTKIAMYGINPKSASDTYRKNSFLECGGNMKDLYINNANLCQCYKDFEPYIHNYDGIICANDYSAISLIRHAQNNSVKVPYIVSCGETKLAKYFNPSITNLKTNYKDFGKAAISVYKTLQKDFSVSSVTVNLASDISLGESTDKLPVLSRPTTLGTVSSKPDDSFYVDKEISEMLCVENILNRCDKTELNMLFSLIDGMTYADIAEKYHMSINGAKYRIHKFFELCHIDSKTDFLELVKKYIG